MKFIKKLIHRMLDQQRDYIERCCLFGFKFNTIVNSRRVIRIKKRDYFSKGAIYSVIFQFSIPTISFLIGCIAITLSFKTEYIDKFQELSLARKIVIPTADVIFALAVVFMIASIRLVLKIENSIEKVMLGSEEVMTKTHLTKTTQVIDSILPEVSIILNFKDEMKKDLVSVIVKDKDGKKVSIPVNTTETFGNINDGVDAIEIEAIQYLCGRTGMSADTPYKDYQIRVAITRSKNSTNSFIEIVNSNEEIVNEGSDYIMKTLGDLYEVV